MKRWLLISLVIILTLSACQLNFPSWYTPTPLETPQAETSDNLDASPTDLPKIQVTFRVAVPNDTPEKTRILISLLDEVTGLALNASHHVMEAEPPQAGAPRIYRLALSFPAGSIIKYRYARQDEAILVSEHTANGNPVRYRLYSAISPATLSDVVSRWTDTQFQATNGRILGEVTDNLTGKPLPNILICVGGSQTISAADGTFRVDHLPVGIHNLVAYALDGTYQTFQQGAQIAAESTTPTPLKMVKSQQVQVTFEVKAPDDTPPIVPLRLAGNLWQLGNTFATLHGGISSLAANMPVLHRSPAGLYTVTISLPVGADVQYKYTLGDGFWNAEQTAAGNFKVRQFIVPVSNTLIQDDIETWHSANSNGLTFDVTTPPTTPVEDEISLQLNPLFGWTEPIPMWKLGENHWGYILFSPLNLPGNFSYRYCRNGMCGSADDMATPGEYGKGRPVNLRDLPKTVKDAITGWANYDPNMLIPALPEITPNGRGSDFMQAVALDTHYHPTATSRFPQAITQLKQLGANWIVLTPGWTFSQLNPPVIELLPGKNPFWHELVGNIDLASQNNLQVALFPTPEFELQETCLGNACPPDRVRWWDESPRDEDWWQVWFEQYRKFATHFADLAAQTGVTELILGGNAILPALPVRGQYDNNPSPAPANAEQLWQTILEDVRQRFTGKIAWAVTTENIQHLPDFVNTVDHIYLIWDEPGLAQSQNEPLDSRQAARTLDDVVHPIQYQINKPLILAVSLSAQPDLQKQWDDYSLIMQLVNERPWISGIVSQGYSPWALLQDHSASIYGKPASVLLQAWFTRWLPGGTP